MVVEARREIVKMQDEATGETTERWTGNYLFENEWQSFRSKKSPDLEFLSAPHVYRAPGTYQVMVKVVDILGIDTSRVFEVKIV